MTTRFLKAVTLLACAVFSTLALADPPARVGRVSLAQGQVTISSEVGDEASAALVNWPVTSHNQITTGRGARTEIRVGSTSIRLDGDTSMEVSELDDDSLRLRLHYGSASVRVRNAEVLPGFELSTPNGLVRLQEPGRMRVDAERERGTTVVNVFDGVALVEDRGSQLIVRAGKRAEIRDDDVRTGLAVNDSFDDWARLRDQREDGSMSARYVTSEMTGYEDLDQHGIWRDDPEYGPLWLPRAVAPGWAPYRDGNWTWISPWGWTWVDNAPWGYAPFHYGRWVHVHQRWAWAPGRHIGRPVWAPALVGWIGGSGWSLSFGSTGGRHHRPAQGWYPLSPHDFYVPGYRLSHDHLQRINRGARRDGRHDGRRDHHHRHHREGLTVVPHEHFGRRGTIAVRNAPKAVVPPLALQNAPAAAPPPPQGWRDREGRGGDRFDRSDRDGRGDRSNRADRDGRDGRDGRDAGQRNRGDRPEITGTPAPRPPLVMPPPQVVTGGQVPPQPPADRSQFGRREGRPDLDDRRQRQQPAPAAAPVPQVITPPPAAEQPQRGRQFRGDGERRMREPDGAPPVFHQQTGPAPAPVRQAPPVFHQQTAPAPAPVRQAPPPVFHQQTAPAPAPVFHQQPAPAPAPAARPAAPPPVSHQQTAPAPAARPAPPPPVFHQQTAPPPAQQAAPAPRPERNNQNNQREERRRGIDKEPER